MDRLFQKTMREQVQKDLETLCQSVKNPTPKVGWIKIIRTALGMTSYQLAKRLGCAQSNVMALEAREKAKTVSLKALEQAAKAMDCHVVYFFVPNRPLEQILENQARVVAKKQLKTIGHSMALEQQELTQQQEKSQEDALVQELLQSNSKRLWEE